MTDMRRTLLWVVFSMSLFLLWDAWNKHNGQPSFFSPAPAKVAAAGSAPGSSAVPVPSGTLAPTSVPGAATAPSSAAPTSAAQAEQVTIATDLVRATLSTEGATLVRIELLKTPEHIEKQWYEPLTAMFGRSGQHADEFQAGTRIAEHREH